MYTQYQSGTLNYTTYKNITGTLKNTRHKHKIPSRALRLHTYLKKKKKAYKTGIKACRIQKVKYKQLGHLKKKKSIAVNEARRALPLASP